MKQYGTIVIIILCVSTSNAIEPKKADCTPCQKMRGDEVLDNCPQVLQSYRPYITRREVTMIGNTAYDYQANGGFGQRVALDSYDQASINWMWQDYPGQTLRYCAFNKRLVGGTYQGETQVSNSWSGYVQLDVTREANPDSQRAVIAYHYDAGSGYVSWIDFEPFGDPKTPGIDGGLWPYIAATNNGNIILATGDYNADMLHLYLATDEGSTWTLIADFDSCACLSQFLRASNNAGSNKVVFVWTQYIQDSIASGQLDNNVWYMLSDDGGITWGQPANITDYQPYPTDSVRAYCCVNAVFDLNDNLHIAWAGRKVTDNYYQASKIFHWDEVNNTITIVSSPSIYYSEPGGWWINEAGYGEYGAWRMPADQPQLTVGLNAGDLVCFWGGNDDYNDYSAGGFINGEIYGSYSTDGGLTWYSYFNFTNTRSPGANAGECMDEDYFTVYPRYHDGGILFHGVYTYIVDKDAGGIVHGEGALTENPVYCYYSYWPGGLKENDTRPLNSDDTYATFYTGPLNMIQNKPCKIFDINGRQIYNIDPPPGVYFIKEDSNHIQKVIKVK